MFAIWLVVVCQGISNEADDVQRQEQLRPPRALTRDPETGELFLDKFSAEAAEAQASCCVFSCFLQTSDR